MTTGSISHRGWLLILLAVVLVWFSNLDARRLVRPDEGRYAEIPREMVASGDWLTPRLNGLKYFEKPALQYWATAAAYTAFGEHEWTARLWPALTGFFGLFMVVYTGRQLFGRAAGIYAGMVLGSSMLYAGMAHVITLDTGVSVFMGLTLCAFLLAQQDGATPRASRNWMWLAWAAMGLAVLSKGLQGVVLPGGVLVLHTLIERDFALWKRLHIASGLAIFLVVAAPWFVAVSLANPGFFHFFFIHEHFERFLTTAHHRYRPWWYFVPILLLGMLPWMIVLFDALANAWRRESGRRFQPKRFLLIWVGFIFLFFSASSSKLPSYILPIFPALALLIGARLTDMSARRLAWLAGPVVLAAAAGLGVAPFLERFASDEVPAPLFVAYMPWLIVACVALGTGVVFALLIDRTGQREFAVLALAAGGLGFAQLVLTGHDSFAPSQSAYHLVEQARPELARDKLLDRPEVPFYSVGFYEQTLPFYIKRTVTLVAHRDELEFGIAQEPQKFIPTIEEFEKRWRADREALAIVQPYRYRDFTAAGLPMQLVAQDTRRVIVRKPQTPARSP